MMPHYLGLNLCYSRKPLLIRKLLLLLMSRKKSIRFETCRVRNSGCKLKKNRCHESKHNAVYDMTTKAHKRRVVAQRMVPNCKTCYWFMNGNKCNNPQKQPIDYP